MSDPPVSTVGDPHFPIDQQPIEPYFVTSYAPHIELASYFNDTAAKKIGHVRKVLESIASHIGSYYKKALEASFPQMDMADVEVYLPLMQSVKIEGSRYQMTSIILSNAMKSTETSLRPGIVRSSYQLPTVFTAFVSTNNAKASDIPFLYEMFSTLPLVLRHYDGTQLGVMRVSINNSQMSRNPMAMEAFDSIIQFNMNIAGIIDYAIGKDGELEFSAGQNSLMNNIRRSLVSNNSQNAGAGAVGSGQGNGSGGSGGVIAISAIKSAKSLDSGQQISMISMDNAKNLFVTDNSTKSSVLVDTAYLSVSYSSPENDSRGGNIDSGISITEIKPFGTLNYANAGALINRNSLESNKTILFSNDIGNRYTTALVRSELVESIASQSGSSDSDHLITETVFKALEGAYFEELINSERKGRATSTSDNNVQSNDPRTYIITVNGKGGNESYFPPGSTQIMVYGNDGSMENILRFIYNAEK